MVTMDSDITDFCLLWSSFIRSKHHTRNPVPSWG